MKYIDPFEMPIENKRIIEPGWIQVYSGKRFDLLNTTPDMIELEDIAQSLSNLCRFTGHLRQFYSVAQHSVYVSQYCDPKDSLHGLLHDATEAFCADINSPLKHLPEFEFYRKYENRLQQIIFQRFNLNTEEPASVKMADKLLLATEARDLLSTLHPDWVQEVQPLPFTIVPLPPTEAKQLFLNRFEELTK